MWRFLECGVYITCIECCVRSITRVGQRRLLVLHVCGQFMFPVGAVWFEVRLGITDHTCIQYSVYSGVSIWEPDLLLRVLTRVVSESGEFA